MQQSIPPIKRNQHHSHPMIIFSHSCFDSFASHIQINMKTRSPRKAEWLPGVPPSDSMNIQIQVANWWQPAMTTTTLRKIASQSHISVMLLLSSLFLLKAPIAYMSLISLHTTPITLSFCFVECIVGYMSLNGRASKTSRPVSSKPIG